MGIDVGTTNIKAALFRLDDTRAPVAVASRPSPTRSPLPGRSETDPLLVRAAVASCVRELMASGGAAPIGAIGVSGTACGAWLVADGEPVRPAILWNDGRAADIVDAWRADGRMAEIFEISGNIPFPGYTLPVLRWLAEHEPQHLSDATHLLFCKDFIRGWLTGVWLGEETDASYAPFDIRSRGWSDRLLALAKVDEYARLLPPQLARVDRIDPLLASAASELGLPEGVPVAMGATDMSR